MRTIHSIVAFALLFAFLLSPLAWAEESIPTIPSKSFADNPSYKVVKVVDGDTVTLLIDGKQVKTRLIGVDTPETVHPSKPVQEYGKEASRFLKNLLEGERVYVEHEPGPSNTDRYGRLLAYLYREPDGLFVNLEIVRQGYGHAYTQYPFQYMDLFRFYERKARESGKGLWGAAPPAPATQRGSATETQETMVYIKGTGKKYHKEGCRYLAGGGSPLSLTDAKARGYDPCSVCKPPQ